MFGVACAVAGALRSGRESLLVPEVRYQEGLAKLENARACEQLRADAKRARRKESGSVKKMG